MAGLKVICRMYGGMTVSSNGKTVKYVYDYANDTPCKEDEMPLGSDRHAASEIAKAELIRQQFEQYVEQTNDQ